jgi:hypothetical protein
MWLSSDTLKLVASEPPIDTAVAPVKLVPAMVVEQGGELCPEILPELGVIDVTVGVAADACVAAAISSTAAAKMPLPRRRILTIALPAGLRDAAAPSAVRVAPDPITPRNHASGGTALLFALRD